MEYLMLGREIFLEVDNRLVLPNDLLIRFVCSSSDVIHAWVLPIFFLKTDVISGLITVFRFNFDILGLFLVNVQRFVVLIIHLYQFWLKLLYLIFLS
uniref:Cytochrome oxidase subunit II copper A binding domain-containing protein n=4 Tax=Meloidogyne incognita TaxID=6306 RepID=A0A914N371_MELIC